MKPKPNELASLAIQARETAYAPFSGFKVGAALASDDNHVYTGCNVENSTYGLTVCAERVAIFKAVSEGKRKFKAMAVAADTEKLTPPCGACRQIIWEFCGDIEITLVNLRGKKKKYRMRNLLPEPFDVKFLEEKR
jgi:cytidine deaminase